MNHHSSTLITDRNTNVEAAVNSRHEHSRSPSDGMILTASGLRDTMSMSHSDLNNSNVVIVDGTTSSGLHNENDNVYLTTS